VFQRQEVQENAPVGVAGRLPSIRVLRCRSALEVFVPCVECETNPVTPGHFCECCGRKLSEAEKARIKPYVAPVALCASCGAPAEHGDLCRACRKSFGASAAEVAMPTANIAEEPANPEIVRSDTAKLESARLEAARAEAARLKAELAKQEAERLEAVKAEERRLRALDARPTMNTVAIQRIQKPAPAIARPSVPAVKRHQTWAMAYLVIFAFVALAAFAVGIFSLKLQLQPSAAVVEQQPASAAITEVSDAPSSARPQKSAPAPAPARSSSPAPTRPSAPTKNRPAVDARPPAVPAKVERASASPVEAQVSTRNAVNETPPAAAAAPAPRPVAVNNAPVEPPAEPRGPLFDPSQVQEAPRVATRVEPKLPPSLRNIQFEDVVIVRLLVSETGRPSRVSLLRRSKIGQPIDDAVMAAVNQWTFAPARRKGEAVSSWYNVGVPISGAKAR
jgi:protein TonB